MGVILLTGLVLAKVSAFHIYEHHHTFNEQEEQCEFCLLAIDSQKTEVFISSLSLAWEEVSTTLQQNQIIVKHLDVLSDTWKADLFSRPPPSLFS